MAGKLEFLTKSILNQPLLADEDTVHLALDFLENRWNFKAMDFAGATNAPTKDTSEGHIAQISIIGPMMKRAGGLEALCGAKDYTTLRNQFDAAFDNPNVDTVVLELESGGGDAAGLFDLARHVYDKKEESGKKLIAYVDSIAASAAYAMACVADEIIVADTASVGSIGVITTHADVSQKLEKEGIVITPIYAGAFKAAGNPYETLSEETKTMIQERVDSLYTIFVDHVAEMRGMTSEAVRATEAKMFLANEAIELGLADKIMSMDEFMAYLYDDGETMDFTRKNKTQENAVSENNEVSMTAFEDLQAKLAEMQEAIALKNEENKELAAFVEQSKAVLKEKEEAELAAKLEGFKEQASAFVSFGLDAEQFAQAAMNTDAAFVEMVTSALETAKTQLENSDAMKELGAEVEGEGVEKKDIVLEAVKAKNHK